MRWQKPKLEYVAVGLEIGAYRSPSSPWPPPEPGAPRDPDGTPDAASSATEPRRDDP